MRVALLAAAVAFAGVYGLASAARACSCLPPQPPAKAAAEADAVFEGRTFSHSTVGSRLHYEFEVLRVWKGDVSTNAEVVTASSGAACGRSYQTGRAYVVYAYRRRDGTLGDGLCTRTRATDNAAEDIAALGPYALPRTDGPPKPDPGGVPTEPPRIDAPPPVVPATTRRRGCHIGENPHAQLDLGSLLFVGLCVAAIRRRTVRSR